MKDSSKVYVVMAGYCGEEESGFVRSETGPSRLINSLAREKHITPFCHPHVTFECEAPIAIARQLGKHQVGFRWNERSMRYKDSVIDVYVPDMFRGRPDNLHSGSADIDVSGQVVFGQDMSVEELYRDAVAEALDSYTKLVEAGLAPEQARFVLPQGMITRWIWTGSLYGWYEVWRQRSSEHAQYEARLFASQLDTHMSSLLPIAWEALKENK